MDFTDKFEECAPSFLLDKLSLDFVDVVVGRIDGDELLISVVFFVDDGDGGGNPLDFDEDVVERVVVGLVDASDLGGAAACSALLDSIDIDDDKRPNLDEV